jgi:hypothetical protein
MFCSALRVLVLLSLLVISGVACATAPITADLSITFRLYAAQSGGAALRSETQPAVQVDRAAETIVSLGIRSSSDVGSTGRISFVDV